MDKYDKRIVFLMAIGLLLCSFWGYYLGYEGGQKDCNQIENTK